MLFQRSVDDLVKSTRVVKNRDVANRWRTGNSLNVSGCSTEHEVSRSDRTLNNAEGTKIDLPDSTDVTPGGVDGVGNVSDAFVDGWSYWILTSNGRGRSTDSGS